MPDRQGLTVRAWRHCTGETQGPFLCGLVRLAKRSPRS